MVWTVSEDEIKTLVEQNRERYDRIFGDYDPFSGLNCYAFDKRKEVRIVDFPAQRMWVHQDMFENVMFRRVAELGSITLYLEENDLEATHENIDYVVQEICRLRSKNDPEFAIYITDKILHKDTGKMVPFKLNYPQRLLLSDFEDARRAHRAIMQIVLKARQWGGSTLTQLYMKWIQDFRRTGWNSIVIAQSKKTSKKIKAMYRKAIESQEGWTLGKPGEEFHMAPYEGSMDDFRVMCGNKILRDSILTVSAFEVVTNDRGENHHMAHYSEVAYWKQTPEHDPEEVISTIHSGIDEDTEDNMEVYESTGYGMAGLFYDMWKEASNKDIPSNYKALFIPFYVIERDHKALCKAERDSDEYREAEREFARWLLENRDVSTNLPGWRESGKFFWRLWRLGADFEAINWYRNKRNGYPNHTRMATEAPVDPVEAFRSAGNLIFNMYSISELRDAFCKEPVYRGEVFLKGEKGKDMLKQSEIRFHDYNRKPEYLELKIWQMPNNNILRITNRYIVSVDIGGNSANADYSVMTVIDRMGMAPGVNGRPAVVARWRSHCRHDVLAWKAAVLAKFYDNALLVIESNTADRERNNNTEGEHSGTIIEQISDYYDNLYMRAPASENITDTPLRKFGFQTNRQNKQWLIDNLVAYVEDKLWEEPDEELYRELSIYERRPDGSMGNVVGRGNHDDVLMSTAIGLWISAYDMDKPEWRKNKSDKYKAKMQRLNEASF